MTAIIISIVALTISLILATRLLLLDKDYCEFSIIDHGGGNTGLIGNLLERKRGYTLTQLSPKIQSLKCDVYDIEITGVDKNKIKHFKSNKIAKLNCGEPIEISDVFFEPTNVKISYRDSKNNLYAQTLVIKPA